MLCDRQPLCQPVLGHVIADGESLPAMLLSSWQLQENSTRSLCNVVILFFVLNWVWRIFLQNCLLQPRSKWMMKIAGLNTPTLFYLKFYLVVRKSRWYLRVRWANFRMLPAQKGTLGPCLHPVAWDKGPASKRRLQKTHNAKNCFLLNMLVVVVVMIPTSSSSSSSSSSSRSSRSSSSSRRPWSYLCAGLMQPTF